MNLSLKLSLLFYPLKVVMHVSSSPMIMLLMETTSKTKLLGHSSDIRSIRFKHTRIIHFFGLFKKYLKILDTKANFQAFVLL
jgi:hypothetical protein